MAVNAISSQRNGVDGRFSAAPFLGGAISRGCCMQNPKVAGHRPKHRPRWWPAECETLTGQLLGSNVTCRYSTRDVLYPFGYGLSYATFKFSVLKHAASVEPCGTIDISVTVHGKLGSGRGCGGRASLPPVSIIDPCSSGTEWHPMALCA